QGAAGEREQRIIGQFLTVQAQLCELRQPWSGEQREQAGMADATDVTLQIEHAQRRRGRQRSESLHRRFFTHRIAELDRAHARECFAAEQRPQAVGQQHAIRQAQLLDAAPRRQARQLRDGRVRSVFLLVDGQLDLLHRRDRDQRGQGRAQVLGTSLDPRDEAPVEPHRHPPARQRLTPAVPVFAQQCLLPFEQSRPIGMPAGQVGQPQLHVDELAARIARGTPVRGKRTARRVVLRVRAHLREQLGFDHRGTIAHRPRYAPAPRMNVAFALFRYFPFGGMQRDMLAAARRCHAAGHEVRVLCHTWEGERPDELQVDVLQVAGHSNHGRAGRFAAALAQHLRQRPADAVVGFDKLPGLDLYFAADPCFVARTAARSWPYRWTPRYRTFRRLEGAVFGPHAGTRVLLLDPRERAHYQRAWHTPDDRFELLPPGVARDRRHGPDADQLRRSGRAEFGIDENQILLLMLASNLALKGFDRVVAAMRALPPDLRTRTRLLAVGQPPDATLRRHVAAAGLTDRVAIVPGRADVPRLLQAADALVHPAYRDTTGTVLLEAIVAGLPVLCTAVCGYAPHVRQSGAGIVLDEPFSAGAMRTGLLDLLTGERATMRANALRHADRNDLHGMHDAILRAIEAAPGHTDG
ncbi:MAG TPA: glycosyltransferase, partial [bacterium]|nr:glycosyltransferase [bacterium]